MISSRRSTSSTCRSATTTRPPTMLTTPPSGDCSRQFETAGVVVVAAAGNDATRAKFFPAGFAGAEVPGLIGVGATNPDDRTVALFSNNGTWVTAHAPGAGVVSTVPTTLSGSAQANVRVRRSGPRPALERRFRRLQLRVRGVEWHVVRRTVDRRRDRGGDRAVRRHEDSRGHDGTEAAGRAGRAAETVSRPQEAVRAQSRGSVMHTDDTVAAPLDPGCRGLPRLPRPATSGRMDELVHLVTPVLWHTARAQGMPEGPAQDAVQTAWLRLVENVDRIKDPQAVMGWLIVTVRRECWRVQKSSSRRRPRDRREPGR